MAQHPYPPRDPLVADVGVRFRLPLPVVIPLAALAVIAIVAVGFSRVLLAVPKEAAVVIALVTALNVLGACAVFALRPAIARTRWPELIAVTLYPIIIGIGIWALGIGAEAEHTSAGERAGATSQAPAAGGALTVTAQNVSFDTDTLELPAGEETTIHFVNEDSVEHNIAIYESDAAENDLFVGDIISGGSDIDYAVPPLEEGTYYFQCDVHPQMNGDVQVSSA